MRDWRCVLDTNVIISAMLFPRSVPRQAFDRAWATAYVLGSTATLRELDEVARRSSFDRYVTREQRMELVAAVIRDSVFVEVIDSIIACRDPKDDKFLDLAVSGQATHIISGDRDLLDLHPFRGIFILKPQDFLALS